MTTSHRNPEYEAAHEEHPHYWAVLTVLLIVALMLTGCAAVKPLGELLLGYGVPAVKELLADAKERGKVAIDEARARAEAIPDQLDRIEALAEVNRAEQVYQTSMLEYLVSCHPPDMPEPTASPSPVTAGAR